MQKLAPGHPTSNPDRAARRTHLKGAAANGQRGGGKRSRCVTQHHETHVILPPRAGWEWVQEKQTMRSPQAMCHPIHAGQKVNVAQIQSDFGLGPCDVPQRSRNAVARMDSVDENACAPLFLSRGHHAGRNDAKQACPAS